MTATAEPDAHIEESYSYWSGQITALCGATAESGGYATSVFNFPFAPRCPECVRLSKRGHAGRTNV